VAARPHLIHVDVTVSFRFHARDVMSAGARPVPWGGRSWGPARCDDPLARLSRARCPILQGGSPLGRWRTGRQYPMAVSRQSRQSLARLPQAHGPLVVGPGRIAPSELALGQYPERLTGRQCPEPTLLQCWPGLLGFLHQGRPWRSRVALARLGLTSESFPAASHLGSA